MQEDGDFAHGCLCSMDMWRVGAARLDSCHILHCRSPMISSVSDYDIVGDTYDIIVHIVPTMLLNIVGHNIICTTYDVVGLTS
jgi:hypothetical protein